MGGSGEGLLCVRCVHAYVRGWAYTWHTYTYPRADTDVPCPRSRLHARVPMPSSRQVNLSTRPEKSVGSDEIWTTAEAALVEALNAKGWKYQVGGWGR